MPPPQTCKKHSTPNAIVVVAWDSVGPPLGCPVCRLDAKIEELTEELHEAPDCDSCNVMFELTEAQDKISQLKA